LYAFIFFSFPLDEGYTLAIVNLGPTPLSWKVKCGEVSKNMLKKLGLTPTLTVAAKQKRFAVFMSPGIL